MWKRWILRGLLAGAGLLAGGLAAAQVPAPATVTVGTYVNKIVDLSFKERKYTIDFYLWFRWKAEGRMADYDPLESFELINGRSEFSRVSVSMALQRAHHGAALKMLVAMVVATCVAFVAFVIKPTDVDPRFGMGIGALFAVTANAFIVASAVPDSSALTLADTLHMIAMAFIFASLVQSANCLRWDESGQEARSRRLDRWCVILFPSLFALIIGSLVLRALP